MNHQEFKDAFEGLTSIYGDKSYPPAIKAKLFGVLHGLHKADFVRVVDNLVMENTKPPAAGIILRACVPFLRTANANAQSEAIRKLMERPRRCQVCDNYGIVFRFLRENTELSFQFKCVDCDAHTVRKVGAGVPVWLADFSKLYMTLEERNALEKADWAAKAKVPAQPQEVRDAMRAQLKQLAADGVFDGPMWGEG